MPHSRTIRVKEISTYTVLVDNTRFSNTPNITDEDIARLFLSNKDTTPHIHESMTAIVLP
jgi:hypothetical protein